MSRRWRAWGSETGRSGCHVWSSDDRWSECVQPHADAHSMAFLDAVTHQPADRPEWLANNRTHDSKPNNLANSLANERADERADALSVTSHRDNEVRCLLV